MSTSEVDFRTLAVDPVRCRAETAAQGHLAEILAAGPPLAAWQFVSPQAFCNGNTRLSLRAQAAPEAPQVTEALPGEALEWLWDEGEWARVRTTQDRYLGWVKRTELHLGGAVQTDLLVTALRAHAFAGPAIEQPVLAELSLGVRLSRRLQDAVQENHRCWIPVRLPDGEDAWVQEVCFAPLTSDPATLALRFLETPYVWGGRSAWGLDCSGLTQLVYSALGHDLPRDADQQRRCLTPVACPAPGDLAFFPGHVGLMLSDRTMVHANATHMRVSVETLGEGEYGQRLAQSCTGFGSLR